MSAFGKARAWMRAVFLRSHAEREMHAEMNLHIEQATERFVARGMSERDARHAARKEFGQASVLQEEARDARGGRWVEILVGDARHAFRYFARTPVTTGTIAAILALAIGLSSVVFAMAMSLQQPPPGIPDNASLVMIRGSTALTGRIVARELSYEELKRYSELRNTFESVSGWTSSDVVLDQRDDEIGTTSVSALFVTPNYFQTLGTTLDAGTGFRQAGISEISTFDFTVIVRHEYAMNRFGSAANAVGKHVRLNDVDLLIVGVAPARFRGVYHSGESEVFWLPMSGWRAMINPAGDPAMSLDSGRFAAVGLLHETVKIETANAALAATLSTLDGRVGKGEFIYVAGPIAEDSVSSSNKRAINAPPPIVPKSATDVVRLRGDTSVESQNALLTELAAIMIVVGLIFMVCITTVSSLLVAAGVNRRNEIGVRLALGASRMRIVRQLLTESAILALSGGVVGLLLSFAAYRVFVSQGDFTIPAPWETIMFTVAFAIVVAILCGLSPALHATRDGLSEVLKDSARNSTSRSRLQRTFVVAQIALTQPLLVGLGVMIGVLRTFAPQHESATGDHLIVANIDMWSARRLPEKTGAAVDNLMRRVATLPGVESVLKIGGMTMRYTLEIEGTTASAKSGSGPFKELVTQAPNGYFKTVGIPILRGREFNALDGRFPTLVSIIITKERAIELFGTDNVLGRRLHASRGSSATNAKIDHSEFEIVGVIARSSDAIDGGVTKQMFMPQGSQLFATKLLIRTTQPGISLIPTLQSVAKIEAPLVPVREVKTLTQKNAAERNTLLQALSASAAGGMVVLFLAAIGLYAVVALSIGQRKREIGIRVAMGARPGQVVAMFFGRGVKLSLIGLAVGLPLSAAAAYVASLQPGAPYINIAFIASAIAACVVSVAAIASWLPARRAAHVDPLNALRAE